MTWTLLMPAAAVVVALVTLALGLRRVETEVISLRAALRRSGATAIAADELSRSARDLRLRAAELETDVRQRLHRPHRRRRLRSASGDR